MAKSIGFLAVFLVTCSFASSYHVVCTNELIIFPSSPVVLVTGFEPFADFDINPSQIIVEELQNQTVHGLQVVGVVLPVNFTSADMILVQVLQHYQPFLMISLGLSPKATTLEVETWAVNMKRYPLDSGRWSFPRKIEQDGPLLRLSSLNTRAVIQELKNHDIPSEQSFFAGTYLCNYVFYRAQSIVKTMDLSTHVGFIHVPLLDVQSQHGMKLQTMVDGVKVVIGLYSTSNSI
ncbi:MAG: hypothetical protein QXX20_01115 [Candidatus Thermoplasmatota archaeon]